MTTIKDACIRRHDEIALEGAAAISEDISRFLHDNTDEEPEVVVALVFGQILGALTAARGRASITRRAEAIKRVLDVAQTQAEISASDGSSTEVLH